jgi:LPS-assembly lipoprotein
MKQAWIIAALVLAAPVGGCGFHPLYGDTGATADTADKLASIYVEPIEGQKLGYELRNTLIDLFDASGRPSAGTYRLRITLTHKSEGVAVQNDAAITRYNDTLTVKFVLTNLKGETVTEGAESGLSAYNVVSSPYATLIAQQDADERAAQDIAYRIRTDLAVFFGREANIAPSRK